MSEALRRSRGDSYGLSIHVSVDEDFPEEGYYHATVRYIECSAEAIARTERKAVGMALEKLSISLRYPKKEQKVYE